MLKTAALVPHPPIIIPEVDRGQIKEVEQTIKAMKKLAQSLAQKDPSTLIVITPHGPLNPAKLNIAGTEKLQGDLKDFGADLNFEMDNNLGMAEKIVEEANAEGIPATLYRDDSDYAILDHGVLVPLYYLLEDLGNVRVIPITYAHLDRNQLFAFGQVIEQIAKKEKGSIGLIASGDLSHRLSYQAPAGYSKIGKEFDQMIITYLKEGDLSSLIKIEPEIIEQAGECGYPSLLILLGAIYQKRWKADVLSYEGPFGVGYAVVDFKF